MAVIEDAVNVAAGVIGTAEDPDGSNHNFITEFYADVSGQEWARRNNPWCAMFITWLLHQVGLTWFIYAYCPYIERDAKAGVNGMSWTTTPTVGAAVLYDLNGSRMATHVGFVISVRSDGSFVTIEGNWRNAVYRLVRDTKYVRGFAIIPFDNVGEAPAPPAQQQTGGRPVLRKGSKGQAVKTVQEICIAAGISAGDSGADGDFGIDTETAVKALQARLGVGVDGVVGPETYEAIDRLLAWLATNPQTPITPPVAGAQLEEDGVLGPETIKALQRKVGVTDDGVMGRDTITALQQYLGTFADGIISRPRSQMVMELQRRVGAGVDGEWGPDTTLHLQQALNAGSF